MRSSRLASMVFAGLVALELALLAFVDTTTRPLDRTGPPFQLQNIASGTTLTQRLEVGADGFDEIQLDGSITPGSAPAVLIAKLVEVDVAGTLLRELRSATIELAPTSTRCCRIRFEPLADSRWRLYRLDLTVGALNGRHLLLWAVPGPVNGRLTVNGKPQVAFLVFSTRSVRGTGLARLRHAPAAKTFALVGLTLLCNAAVATAVHLLTTAFDPRPA